MVWVKTKLMEQLGVSKEKSEELFTQYHGKAPFVKQLMNKVMSAAQERAQIRTLLNRKCRFPKYETCIKRSRLGNICTG
jgi:DNA polymerase I-like protein with 3'-5' exonuclease and polymerase domains